ncbi:MAG: PAS domain-containing sensor histidine kinase [Elusimicrobiota bacterium]|jgi:PAS domain S-box-containing protein
MNDSDRLYLEVLKTLGKTLSQMNLYSAVHPAVRAMIGEALQMLATIQGSVPEGKLVYSLDGDKVIANGRVVGSVKDLPTSIPMMFSRHKLSSITFQKNVSVEDLTALCQLAALRPEAAKGVVPAQFLGERSVTRIVLNEAVYAKVDELHEKGGSGVGAGKGGTGQGSAICDALARAEQESLEKTIDLLAQQMTQDPEERRRIFEAVMNRVRAELEQKVRQATKEFKQQNTVLQNEQVRTQAVLSNVADGVVVVDDSGRVLMMNSAAEELYGTSLSQMAGKPLSDQTRGEHLLALSKDGKVPADAAIQGDVAVAGDDEARRTLRASTAIVQTEGGKPVGVVSSLSDVAKYREMQKMQREFVAHVTHELRSPLTAIRAALEILESAATPKLKEDEKRVLVNALRNTDRLEDLVNSILDFSKIESGQMTVHPQPVRPEAIVQEAVDSMKPWAQKKGLQFDAAPASGLSTIMADPKRTVQVLINLVSNAIKFTPAGGKIRIGAVPGRSGERTVLFNVSDTGPGIPKAEQTRIFEKFVQIAAGEKHAGGTGLGLSIAKAFVHLQHGRMWVESEVGQGANFLFTIPCHTESAGATPVPAVAQPKSWWQRLFGS